MPESRGNIADVICIGAQKAGTSWLHYVLQGHPDLYAFPNASPLSSTNKEAHFWDRNRARGIEWYRSLLRPPSPGQLSMDFTPEYALLSESEVAECKMLNPGASIIYLVRDPVERAVSALRMYAKWDACGGPIRADDRFFSWVAQHRILEHSRYSENLARWRKHYTRLLVINYKEICMHPARVRDEVIQFLGVRSSLSDKAADRQFRRRAYRRVWASDRIRVDSGALSFLERHLSGERELFRQQVGIELGRSWRDWLPSLAILKPDAWRRAL